MMHIDTAGTANGRRSMKKRGLKARGRSARLSPPA